MGIDVEKFLRSATLEQKVALLAGADLWHTAELSGLPVLRCSDGPAGVRGSSWNGPRSASLPCGAALGATFDVDLVEEVGRALGREARSKGVSMLLAPTVNLHRTPVGGRNFECFSEDPVLTAHLAVAYVRGVQGERVACCIKHFVANDTEFERMSISSEVDERTLREVYLVPFEAAVRPVDDGGAGVRAVMSAYNRLNGTYASEHRWLLRDVLRESWGFDGVVVSDWFGTHSGAASLEAGLDLEMPGPARHRGERLVEEIRAGGVGVSRVDESVRRIIALFDWCGLGPDDRPAPESTLDDDATRELARRAAVASTVLLANPRGVLPLTGAPRVALIGPNAERGQIQGGGSAQVRANRPIGPLAALRARGLDVSFVEGCSISRRLPPVRGDFYIEYRGGDGVLMAAPADRLQFLWMDDPAPGVGLHDFTAIVRGVFRPDRTGDWEVGLTAVGAARLTIDGDVVIDVTTPATGGAFFGQGGDEVRATVPLEAGRDVTIEVEVPAETRLAVAPTLRALLVGARPVDDGRGLDEAAAAAAAADVAVVVVGTDSDWESEGADRDDIVLPGAQDELVARVAAANPNTVVVVNAGSPVAMPWADDVAAVMQVWFPGEEFGNALADVLLGDDEPSGRLPITVPRRLAETPAADHHPGRNGRAVYREGAFIGYRWFDAHGIAARFAFGHGLGYTTWALGPVDAVVDGNDAVVDGADAVVDRADAVVDGADAVVDRADAVVDRADAPAAGSPAPQWSGVTVRVPVTNTGGRVGSTVVQCYVRPPAGDPARPGLELRGFAKVRLDPAQTHTVAMWLPERAFAVWDTERGDWTVPPGSYEILVGFAADDLVGGATVVLDDRS